MANNAIFDIATANVIDADFTPISNIVVPNANRINPVISESYEQVNNLFPTSSWNANNWDNRTLPWEGLENAVDLSHLVNTEMQMICGQSFVISLLQESFLMDSLKELKILLRLEYLEMISLISLVMEQRDLFRLETSVQENCVISSIIWDLNMKMLVRLMVVK